MNGSISALLVALVGIFGTLASALLTQRSADRTKLRELELIEERRIDDRTYGEASANLEARRTCYVALNTEARHLHTMLTKFLHSLQNGQVTDLLRDEVDQVRHAHRARNAEAQMVVPDEVLSVSGLVSERLNKLYAMLKRFDEGSPDENESFDAAHGLRRSLWDDLAAMRSAMRSDLGISSDSRDG